MAGLTKAFLTNKEIDHQPPAYGMERWFAMEIPYDKQESGYTVAPILWSDWAE